MFCLHAVTMHLGIPNEIVGEPVSCDCRGKDQPSYSPSMDMGGYVIIINAEKVTVTGNKFNDKLYRSHPTAKPGTLKTETFRQLNEVCAH